MQSFLHERGRRDDAAAEAKVLGAVCAQGDIRSAEIWTDLMQNVYNVYTCTDTTCVLYVCTCEPWEDEEDWSGRAVKTGLRDVFPVQGNLSAILQQKKLPGRAEVISG